jgi:hypothetical protein
MTDEPDTDTRYYERYQARVVQALRDLKASRPQNDEELWYWIWYVLGFAIAWRPVCDEHVAPFQFVADCFFGRKPGVVIRGARGSGKTRSLSTVHLLNSHFDPGFKTAHVGAVQRQGDLCFLPDTPVMMENGTECAIKDIQHGQHVRTGRGRAAKVVQTTRLHYDGPVVGIKVVGGRPTVWATPDHRMLVADVPPANGQRRFPRNGRVEPRFMWRRADEIREGDFVFQPNMEFPTRDEGTEHDEEDGWFVGLYLAEGWSDNKRLRLSLHASEAPTVLERLQPIADRLFPDAQGQRGRPLRVTLQRNSRTQNALDLQLAGPRPTAFVRKYIGGKRAREKMLLPSVFTMSRRFLQGLLAGYIYGDGWVSEKRGEVRVSTASARLAQQLVALIPTSAWSHDQADSSTFGGGVQWQIVWPVAGRSRFGQWRWNVEGGVAWRVRKVERQQYAGSVYCIGVDAPEHSFLAGRFAVANCHGYVREYVKDPYFRSALVKDPLISKTEWRNGSELQILPGTVSATSGPHPNRTVADEFDLMPWEVYQQFIGMAQSTDHYPAQTIYTSAQVTSFGPLARLIAEAPSRGLKVDTFCVLDVMQPCATCEDAERVKRGVKLDPPDCPIWEYCQGRARNATGHLRREDVIARFLQADEDTWLSQHLCRTTSAKGLVYDRFDPTPAELGKTNVSVEAEYNPDLPLALATDDGFSPDPMVLLACQLQPNGDVWVVDEIFATNRLYEEVLGWIHGTELDAAGVAVDTWPWQEVEWDEVRGARPTGVVRHYRKPSAAYTGPSDKQLQAHLAQLGIPILSPTRTNVLDGVGEVRRVICDARGHRGLVLHPRCKNAIAHLQHYHRRRLPNGEYTAEPADNVGRSNPDDGADALRYLIAFRLESARVRLTPL